MLTRAARRRQALRHVERAAETLQLPWLCPALSYPSITWGQRRTTTTRPILPRSDRFASQQTPSRQLASAAPVTEDFDSHDDYLPFSYERNYAASPRSGEQIPFDLSDILMIDQTTALPPRRTESNRSTDLRGDAFEIEATLEACLQVQRWDRAFHILTQLSHLMAGDILKLQQLYNRVLEAMVFDLIWNRNMQNQDRINKWIEVHMRSAGIEPTAQTFALKIKVALATLNGSRRDRTVTRYWEMAKAYQFQNQVASLRDILSDSDLGKLTEICPLDISADFEYALDSNEPTLDLNGNSGSRDVLTSVRETDQKGLGLVSLRQALSLFRNHNQQQPDLDQEEELAQSRQLRLEQDSLQAATDRWKVEHEKRLKMGVAGNMQHGKLGALSWQWHEILTQKIEKEMGLVENAESNLKQTPEDRLRCEYGPFLRLLAPQKLAALTTISSIQYMSKLGVTSSIKLARLVMEVGRVIEAEVEAQQKKAKNSVKKTKTTRVDTESSSDQTSNELSVHASAFSSHRHWSTAIHAKVGAILCELMFDTAKISISKEDARPRRVLTVAEPVFQRQVIYLHGRKIATVTLHAAFRELLMKEPPADLIAKQLPMVSQPKAWTGFTNGGYLESSQPVLRVKYDDIAQRDYARAAADRGDLDQLFAGLDVLGKTGWKVNKDVFQVMLEAWNSGEAVANLPPVDKIFPKVQKPGEDATPMEKWQYYRKVRVTENEKGGLHSNRCFQNFQMEIAQSYLDETFYLPHNVDFRGRAYPIPPYLNQMGADNARGLLLFAKGRALGSEGLRWLQVHLANVFGYDKASLSDRAQFALDHIEEIRDAVKQPLDGKKWWLEAEDPWQCLATCHELVRALDSPDPTEYVSHLPVHQDGTCNGLQHYAALGGDIAGARQVNLEPGDKPADVYTGVAELVKSEIRQDAEQGLEIAQLLDGRITRKIVKQTVMTNVYGVTFTGAIRQVRKQIDDILPDLNEKGQAGQAATYIARKIFKGLGTLFEGAHEIQYWLGDCANRITHSISPAQIEQLEKKMLGKTKISSRKSTGKGKQKTGSMLDAADYRSTVIWTTPLKLPVVQPYRISHTEVVHTSIQGISLASPSVSDAVDPRKQLQGFPPNFVHSLDATHMMLSALRAHELGLSFSAVHDSFWTHAADVKSLNLLLRDAFIRMHSEDIIGRLAAEFRARYKGHWYLAKVGRNNILGKKLQQYRNQSGEARSNIKQLRCNELLREVKRAKLLASENPVERAEGEAMVTAASIFEQCNGQKYLPNKVSLGQTALGDVPDADPATVADALGLQHSGESADINLENTLEPLIDAAESGVTATLPTKKRGRKKKTAATAGEDKDSKNSTWLWLPLSFRDVPKKGEFKVERLRDSTYFFS